MSDNIKDAYNLVSGTGIFIDEKDFRQQLTSSPKDVFDFFNTQESTSGMFVDYNDFETILGLKKKVGAEPSGISQSPFNGKGAALLPTTKSQGTPLLTKEDDTTPNFLPEAVVDFEKYTKGLPKGSKKPSPTDVKKSQEYGMRFGIIPSMQDNPEFQSIGIVKEAGVVEKQYPKIEPAPPKEKIKDLAEPAALLASAINNTKKIDAKAQWEKITPTAQIEYDGYVQQGGTLPIQEYAKERIVELETTDFVGNEIKLRQTPMEVYEEPEGTPSNTIQLVFKALDPNYPQRPAGDIGMYISDAVNELKRKDEHSSLILDNTLKRINSGEVKWDVPGVTMPPEFVGAMKDLKVRTQNRMQVDMSILSKSLTDFDKKYKDHKPLRDSIQAKVADIEHYTSIINAASVEGATPEQIAEAQRIEPLYKKAHGEYQKLMTTYTTLFDKKSVEKYNSDLAAYKQLQQKYNSLPYYFSKYDKEYQNVTNLIGDFNTATGAGDVVVDVIYSSLDQLANALKSTTNFVTQAPYRAAASLTDIEFLDNLVLSFDANTKYKNIHQVSSGFFQDQVGYLPMKELSIEQKKDLARYNPGVDIEKLKPSDFVKTPLDKWKPVNFVATIAATIGEMYLLPNKMSAAVSTMTGASRATAMTSLMYMRSYEDNYSRMLNTEGLSDGERVWLAATLSAMEGLSEQIMPDYKLFDKGSLAKNLVMAYSRGGKAEALRAGSKILLQTAEENLEEQAVLFGTAGLEAITNSLKGREIFEPQDLMGEAVNTALITSAVMGVLGAGGTYRVAKQFFDPANMDAQNLVYLSHDSQFKELPQILNELELGGEITAQKRNEITTMVANIREIKSKLPESLSENFTAIKLMAERNELLSQLKPVDKADFMDVNKDLNHEISLVEKELERMSALAEYQYRNIKEVNYFTEKENGKNVYFKQESNKEKEQITQKEFREDITRLKSFGATLTNRGGLVTFEEVRDKINVYRSETTEALRKKIEEIRYGTVAEGKGKKRGKNKVIPLKLSEARRRQLLTEVIDKLNPEFRQRATPIVETALRELEAGNVSADSIKRLTKSLAQSQQFANMDEVRYNQSTQSFEGIKAGTVVRSIALNQISGNTEWINPFAMQEDTLVHELAAHPYVSTMAMEAGTKDGKLFNFADEAQRDSEYERLMSANLNDLNPQAQILRKGFALIHNTEYISRVESAGYSGKFGLYEEALVQAIGDYGAAMDTEAKRQSFLDIIKDLIKWLGGKAFKDRGLNPREFRNMDIKTYLAAVTSDITTTPGVAPAKLGIRKGRMNFQVDNKSGEILNLKKINPGIYEVGDGKVTINISNPKIANGEGTNMWQLVVQDVGSGDVLLNDWFNTKKDASGVAVKWVKGYLGGTKFQISNVDERVKQYDGIFNPKTTGISGLDDLLQDDGYNYFYKGVTGEVVMMSPDEYLQRVREGLKTKEDVNVTTGKKSAITEAINKGNKINMPFISTKDGKFSQEGRNRATIAKEKGEKLIPVFIEKDVTFSDKLAKGKDYVNSAIASGAITKEEVLAKLKEQGVHRDAIRFIDTNFEDIGGEQSLKETPKTTGISSVEVTAKALEKIEDKNKIENLIISAIFEDYEDNESKSLREQLFFGEPNSNNKNIIGEAARISNGFFEPKEKSRFRQKYHTEDWEKIENWAKSKGIFYENYDHISKGKKSRYGVESEVYLSDDGLHVLKINNLIHHHTFGNFLRRFAAHNIYFPETQYVIEGITKKEGKTAVILKQPFITFSRLASPKDVKIEVENAGLLFNSIYNIRDNYNDVTFRDFHDDNVGYGINNRFIVRDPIIEPNGNDLFINHTAKLYHEAKQNNTNPELVKAVEQSLKETPQVGGEQPSKFQISGTPYTFTGEEKDFEGITVRRIKYGDTVGGWIEFEDNIQGGKVLGDAVVIGDAMVMDDAVVAGKAVIDGTEGRVIVAGTSLVSGDVSITGTVDIDGETMITGHVSINADNLFIKSSTISGNVSIDLQGLANLDGEYIVGTYGINDLADITQETTEAQSFIGGIHNRLRGVWSNVQGFVNRSAEDISSEDIQNISLKSLIERLPITEDDKKIIEDSTKSAMVTGEYKILEDETIIDRINHKVRNIDIIPKNGDIDRQIDALTKSLESMPQNKLKDLVRLRLSDLHATKFLREKWVNEMQSRPGFESTVKDLAIVSDVNDYGTMTRYLVDAEGNSYGNMSVSAHGFVITAAIKRAYHGDTELGSKNKLAEALYRGITNGMIATTGARLKSDGTFQATEYINPKTGLKEERFRAKDFWEKLIKYGYAEIDERGNYVALFQIIGEQGAQYLPKISNDLNIAQAMERDLGLEIDYWDVPDKEQLKKMYKIRLATGWERGRDGLWRYELDPIKLKFSTKEGLRKVLEGKPVMSEGAIRVPLSEIIDTKPFGQHYNLDDVFVYFDPYENMYNAYYAHNAIGVSLTLRSIDSGVTILKTLLSHELQHHIQKKEGFLIGDNTAPGNVGFWLKRDIEDTKDRIKELKGIKEIVDEKDISKYDLQISELEAKLNDFVKLYDQITDEDEYNLYFKRYEEVEARNVEKRIGMTKGERIATLLRHTEDVAPEYQILIPEITFQKSLTEFSENMVVIMSKILGRGLDKLSDTDIKSRYEQFMSEIEEAEGYTPTTRALRAMEDDIIDDAVKFQVEAYHGSPYNVDKFSLDKIGTGEGNQAFGWGLYFTDIKDIAKFYAYTLADEKGVTIETKAPFNELEEAVLREIIIMNGFTTQDQVEKYINSLPSQGYVLPLWSELKTKFLPRIKEFGLTINTPNKNVYKVSLHKGKTPDQYTWLEWDKSVPKSIIDKIQKLSDKEFGDTYISEMFDEAIPYFKDSIGQNIYLDIVKIFGRDPEAASKFLLSAGIDGIKYPAESIARGATSDTARGFNYVVFDENAIIIEEVVKFQMTSPITPDVTNKVLNQLDKEGYPIKSFSRKIVVYNSTDIYIDDKGSMGDLYSDVIFPIFKTRTEALRFLNRAGINLSVPAEVKFAIQPSIPTNEIRQVVKEGMDMMYTPELIRNEIIKIYNLKRKADIEALDVVMDEVYHDKTGKYMVLKNRRSARKAIKNNRGDMYVAETIHDIAERWNQMSDIDKEVVKENASITPGDLASKAFKMVELRLDGKEETEEYLTLYEEMKNAGTQIGKALNIFKLFSVGAQSKEKTLNDRFKLYGKKLPDNVKAEFKKLFKDIEDLTREIKMGAGVLSPIDILIKEADLEKLTRRQDLLWAQYNPEQTSMLRLFDAGKGNLFKIVTMGVNLVSNVVSNITNIAIFTPVSLIRGKAGHVLTKSDLVFGVRKGLPLTIANIVENYKYGTYSSTSEIKVGGFGSHQMLRYFNPFIEAVGATFETYIKGTPTEEVAEKYKMLLTKTKSGDLRITKRDIAKKIWMGTVGANSDIMLRTLVTGDAPFTNTVYLANLKRLARKEGITDEKKINDFITNAPHWAHEVALELAKTATFTQENPATEWIGKFKKSLLNTAETSTNPAKQFGAGAAYITTGVILPFTHVPLNFVYALTKMMAPTVYFADMGVIAGRIKQYDTSIEKEMGKTNPDRNRIEHWNKKKREEKNKLINKSYEMGAVIAVHFVFKLLAMSGAFAATGGDDDKEFKKKQLDKGEVNTVNFGIFLRWINHDRTKIWVPKAEEEDFKINISKLGLLGIVPTVFANNYHKQSVKLRARGQEYRPTLDNTLFDIDSMLEMLTNITPALQESLQLTFVQSISKIFAALGAEGESGGQKAANVTTDLVNTVVTQVMFPNNAVGMFQANRDYIPASNKRFGLEAYPMMERFENLLKNKVNIKGQTIMDEFGNDIPQTPKNFVWGDGLLARWMYHNVSITKITRVGDEKNLAIGMYQKLDDYMLRATDNGIATEPFPITLKDANGISHNMTPEQYQKYCKEMGKIKELLVQNVFNTPGINKLLTLADIELKANVQELEDKNLDPKRKAELLSQMKTEIDMGIITKDGKATNFYNQLTSLTTGVQDEVRHERVRNIINDALWKNYNKINKLYDNYFVHTEMKEQVSEISPEVRNRFINAEEFNLIDSPEIQTAMKTAIETIQLELTDKLNKLTPLTRVDVNN